MMHIVNLNSEYIEPFMIAKSTVEFGQQAFFFKKEEFVLSMHFTEKRVIDREYVRYNWVRMPFKQDFIQVLEEF